MSRCIRPGRRSGRRLLHVDVAYRNQAMAEHVHRRLGLREDAVSQKRLFVPAVRFHEDHFIGHRTKPLDPYFHQPAGFALHDSPLASWSSTASERWKSPSLSFHFMGRISAPAPVSTNMPHRMDRPSPDRLVILVCTTILPIGRPPAGVTRSECRRRPACSSSRPPAVVAFRVRDATLVESPLPRPRGSAARTGASPRGDGPRCARSCGTGRSAASSAPWSIP